MLSIWIGRAGSGKSRRVLEEMARRRADRPQVLLVPEHASHEAEMDLCRCLGPTASRDAEALSFRSLAGRVLAEQGGLADFTLDGGGKLLTMHLVLQELHSQLKVFGRPSRRSAFLRQLTDLADEFYAYRVPPEELHTRVAEIPGTAGDKLRDLALIFAAYDGKLRSGGIDRRSRVQKLADCMAASRYLAGKDVYFDGFSYFNRAEEEVIEALLRQAASVTVTLLGDRAGGSLFTNNRNTGIKPQLVILRIRYDREQRFICAFYIFQQFYGFCGIVFNGNIFFRLCAFRLCKYAQ